MGVIIEKRAQAKGTYHDALGRRNVSTFITFSTSFPGDLLSTLKTETTPEHESLKRTPACFNMPSMPEKAFFKLNSVLFILFYFVLFNHS